MIRRPLLTLAIALLAAVASLLALSRLRVDTSLTSLFEKDDPAAAALSRVLNDFRAVEELLILVEDDHADPAKLIAFADRLDRAISADAEASQLSDGVIYRPDPQMRAFVEQVIVPNGIFYLDDAAMQAAKERLTREGMTAQIRRNESMISVPGPAADALSKTLLKDPLHLHEFVIERIGGMNPMKTAGGDAFISPDGKALLIRIRGRKPVSDLEFARRFTTSIALVADQQNVDHLRVGYAGAYAIAATSERSIRHDMIVTVVSSVILLQFLFIVVYRRPFATFMFSFAPVALGILYGFGAYALMRGTLSPMTAVIGGVLAGMAIDYAVAFLSYYDANRRAHGDVAEMMRQTRSAAARLLLPAWATTVIGFLALAMSRVTALRDFSILGTLGLTGALGCAFLVLPALLLLFDRRSPSLSSRVPIERMLAWMNRHARGCMIACTAMAIVAIVTCASLPGRLLDLEPDLTVMHPRPNAALETQTRIADRFGISPGTMIVQLHADDESLLLALAHSVTDRLNSSQIRDAGVVGSFGLGALLPDPAVAEKRMAATGDAYASGVIADFRATVANSMFEPAAYEPYEQFLRKLLTSNHAPDISDLRRYPALAEMVLPRSPNQVEAITIVFLRDAGGRREARDKVVRGVRNALSDLPGATLTGLDVLGHDTESVVRRDLPRLMGFAIAAIAIYLAIHFRNLVDCLLAVLPAVVGIAALLLFMRVTGHALNMINLMAFPLLIGIDVDYGVYIIAAARGRDLRILSRDQLVQRLAPAAGAVLVCSTTATLGFGSLVTTSVPAIRSLGVIVAVGIAACVAATMLLVVPIQFLRARP